ncbi:MAG: hypothetical protein U1E19_06085 [Rhodoblastus sp.]
MNTPTITDRLDGALRLACGAALALGLWFAVVFAATLVVNPPTIVAFGDSEAILRSVAANGGAPLRIGRGFVAARMPSAESTRALIGRGAWAVWPTTGGTCVDPEVLRKAFSASV